jgi:uncharacterized peroxidase-related enzyme
MAWIAVVAEDEATGRLRALYEQAKGEAGAVANILKIHSLAPHTLVGHLALYKSVMHAPGALPRATREMVAVEVSRVNQCHY